MVQLWRSFSSTVNWSNVFVSGTFITTTVCLTRVERHLQLMDLCSTNTGWRRGPAAGLSPGPAPPLPHVEPLPSHYSTAPIPTVNNSPFTADSSALQLNSFVTSKANVLVISVAKRSKKSRGRTGGGNGSSERDTGLDFSIKDERSSFNFLHLCMEEVDLHLHSSLKGRMSESLNNRTVSLIWLTTSSSLSHSNTVNLFSFLSKKQSDVSLSLL